MTVTKRSGRTGSARSNGRHPRSSSTTFTFLEDEAWQKVPVEIALAILGQVTNVEDPSRIPSISIEGRSAALPFYEQWKLVWLQVVHRITRDARKVENLFALWRPNHDSLLLNGDSAPIHEANEDESLQLTSQNAEAYVRFFLFGLRADGEAFRLFEAAPDGLSDDLKELVKEARPLTASGKDPEDRLLFDARVVFQSMLAQARFAVPLDGSIEMVDEEPIRTEFPELLVPTPMPLGIGPLLAAKVADLHARAGADATRFAADEPGERPRARAGKPRATIVELVELLLERALVDQSQNRLLAYFNSLQPGRSTLQKFAQLMKSSSPVLVLESSIPFVEETVAEIINGALPEGEEMSLYRSSITRDGSDQEVLEGFIFMDGRPGIALVPLQVYRRALHVDRLAYDLATRDLAAIITCERFADLPEGLRRHTDLVLRLPQVDEDLFEELFRRVIGAKPPRRWRTKGTTWLKSVLHTDFEHPRRYALTADKAFTFIQAQVDERLTVVDPGSGMSLTELHGMGEARQWAEDLIADIHAAIKGGIPWKHVDRGALLVGPPGTGKTTLAKAIAKDCGVKFVQGSAASWMAEGVTLGPHLQAIRKTFDEARRYSPSILFIDEIDSIGNRENFMRDNNNVYQTEVVNAVLEQIQGMDAAAPVIVIGATNHEESVDPALRRAGRLDRVIHIPRPNADGLAHIYRYHLAQLADSNFRGPDVDTKILGRLSVGLTGADVERFVRGAARRARKAGRAVSQADLIDEITNKPRTKDGVLRMTPAELERTASHEAGHALAAYLSSSKGADIGFVTIIPREDGTLGFVAPLADDRQHYTRRDYEERLEVYLAGRAAEEVLYGPDQISGGASSDLLGASSLAMSMVMRLGLGGNGKLLSTERASATDEQAAEEILQAAYDRVRRALEKNETKLQALAAALVARQELSGGETRTILRSRAVKVALDA